MYRTSLVSPSIHFPQGASLHPFDTLTVVTVPCAAVFQLPLSHCHHGAAVLSNGHVARRNRHQVWGIQRSIRLSPSYISTSTSTSPRIPTLRSQRPDFLFAIATANALPLRSSYHSPSRLCLPPPYRLSPTGNVDRRGWSELCVCYHHCHLGTGGSRPVRCLTCLTPAKYHHIVTRLACWPLRAASLHVLPAFLSKLGRWLWVSPCLIVVLRVHALRVRANSSILFSMFVALQRGEREASKTLFWCGIVAFAPCAKTSGSYEAIESV